VQHYDVTAEGNFEGHNILNLLKHLPRSNEIEARLAMLRDKLFVLRGKRIRPGLDDKVLADWNGEMIAALANAGSMLDEPDWISRAENAFDFIAQSMTKGDRLGHSWRQGRLLYPGLASDFANMIRAALALYEATGRRDRLDQALRWQTAFDAHYANPGNGGYYLTADDAEGLVVRPASTSDDATPNPNAIAAQNLVRLAALTGDLACRAAAGVSQPRRAAGAGRFGTAAQPSGAGQDRVGTRERGVHLRRRNVFAAGGRSGQDRGCRGRDAALTQRLRSA
jgi:uncharacterized protein YyaL (SSP411 family)